MRRRRENDLDRELRDHLDLEAEEQQEAGLPSNEARYAARRAFGNVTLVKEDIRAMSPWAWLDGVSRDLRYA
jgi:putative ABC transport system permease protein